MAGSDYPTLDYVRLHESAVAPVRAYDESAGYDLSAVLLNAQGREKTLSLAPGTTALVPTGLALRPPSGYLVLICSRSGFAAKGVFVANAPGVVDPDYTGEIKVILINAGIQPFYVKHGERIAQALVVPFAALPLQEFHSFPETLRGDKGFGSTGR